MSEIPQVGWQYKSMDGRIVTVDFVKNNLVVWTYEGDRFELTLSTHLDYFVQDFVKVEK